MLTLQDCLALCGLDEAEVAAIAESEHLPDIVAAELGSCLARRPGGLPAARRMILDDIAAATARGDRLRARHLRAVLRHYGAAQHPAAGDRR
jgi:hypothetical protein